MAEPERSLFVVTLGDGSGLRTFVYPGEMPLDAVLSNIANSKPALGDGGQTALRIHRNVATWDPNARLAAS